MPQTNVASLFPQSFLKESRLHQTLGEEFSLGENGVMVFHWADFHETCDAVKEAMETDSELKADFLRRKSGISHLRNIPVWIKTKNKIHQSHMYDLYERHIFNSMQALTGVDSFGPLEISFISGTGPFKSMSISECFNWVTYRDFVLINVILGKLPRRDFRIRVKSKVLFEYGDNFSEVTLVNLEQLTTRGLLFSVDAEVFQRDLAKNEKVRVILETKSLNEAMGKNLEDLKGHFSRYAFNLMYSSQKEDAIQCDLSAFSVQSSFDFFRNKKAFLFLPYSAFKSEKASAIQNFIEHTKGLVRDFYKQSNKKSA